jgi:hypothetical protein
MQLQKMFSLAALFAATTISGCGGSGSSDPLTPPLPPPPPADTSKALPGNLIVSYNPADNTKSVQGDILASYLYAENQPNTNPPISIADGVLAVDGVLPASKGFAGAAAVLGISAIQSNPKMPLDFTKYKNLYLELQSLGDATELNIKLHSTYVSKAGQTAELTGCLPSYRVKVSNVLTVYKISLNATNFAMPSFCPSVGTAINPAYATAAPEMDQIQIEDNAGNDGTKASPEVVKIRVGRISIE